MDAALAHMLLAALAAYVGAGTLVGVPFVAVGAGRIDAGARGAPWTFRLLILPGVVALWPWIAMRWIGSGRSR